LGSKYAEHVKQMGGMKDKIDPSTGMPYICDFVAGNPHDPVLPSYVANLQRVIVPTNNQYYQYTFTGFDDSKEAVRDYTKQRVGYEFDKENIILTTGCFSALCACIKLITNPGDEIIYLKPAWFFYSTLIVSNYAVPVAVNVNLNNYDIDLEAIKSKINAKTKAIIINTPNNPTGAIYPTETLIKLSEMLTAASAQYNTIIYLISDEAYQRILFDDNKAISPISYYKNSFMCYTYGKTILTPGQKIGFVALNNNMDKIEEMRMGMITTTFITSCWPNADLQYALPSFENENIIIDIKNLQMRRDEICNTLSEVGYEFKKPQGTFYILVKSPIPDDKKFCEILAEDYLYVLPGYAFHWPGYFRICLTANNDMVKKSLPYWKKAMMIAKTLL